ncbi:hypothetical protein FPZ42_07660 [Mucilaginibacter achroorhodeus]|uniref:Uncharacterized protein n=1 Tax=Mucilaginibacter achroorhodeus TaxID=2599294 RepID=A0A563U6C7_9SPHI|nr:hypothetical protein [Mucilaginibacter achroorhodeus]TWR26902.1 hypothetical protein FPZ42_07660 [Mucilaginibacter achroorhodeus]
MDKNKIELVKETAQKLLKFFTETTEEKFEAVKVKDSDTVIEYGSLEVGAPVSISSPNGSEPASDGEYTLVNDVIIEVKDGQISEIKSDGDVAEVEQEELADEESKADETVKEESQAIKDLESRIAKIEEVIKSLTDAKPDQPSKEDLKSFSTELQSAIADLSKIPTQFSSDNRVEVQVDEMDKYKKIAARFSK